VPSLYGITFIWDNSVIAKYRSEIRKLSNGLRNKVALGILTWREAALEASKVRNEILNLTRAKTSPIGYYYAKKLKPNGLEFLELENKYSNKMFQSDFNQLKSKVKMDAVHEKIIIQSGVSRSAVDARLKTFSTLSRGLIAISIVISTYNIISADDKVKAAKKEGAMALSGIAGSVAGGAAAGLICGPGVIACAPVGAFIGGVLAVLGMGYYWNN